MTTKFYNNYKKHMEESNAIKHNFEFLKGFEVGETGHWGELVALYEITEGHMKEHDLYNRFRITWKRTDEEGETLYNDHALTYCKAGIA